METISLSVIVSREKCTMIFVVYVKNTQQGMRFLLFILFVRPYFII